MNTRDLHQFYQRFIDLQFWYFDAEKAANQLEAAITHAEEKHHFDENVAKHVRTSKQANNTYKIDATDSDIIKYSKSFINFVRAVKSLDPKINKAFIEWLLIPSSERINKSYIYWALNKVVSDNYMDPVIQDLILTAYKNSQPFKNLYEHFMAFRFYAVEVGDLIFQLPLLADKTKAFLELFNAAYKNKSNLKIGVNKIKITLKSRAEKQKNILKTENIPTIQTSQYISVFEDFGLPTYLDAMTEIAAIMNFQNQKHYKKELNIYIYPQDESDDNKKLMNAYNACIKTKTALTEAQTTLAQIPKKTGDVKWENLSEEVREQYIKFNSAIINSNSQIERLEKNIQNIPALEKIYMRNSKRIQQQVNILKDWSICEAAANIARMEGTFRADDIFNWADSYADSKLTPDDREAHFNKKKDLYTPPPGLTKDKQNVMLTYNINSRLKRGYAQIQIFQQKGFSLNNLATYHKLLYDIGHIFKEYRQIDSPDLIKQIKEMLETDLDMLLQQFAYFFQQTIAQVQKLELEQGLKEGLLMDQMKNVYGTYLYLHTYNNNLPDDYKLNLDYTLFSENLLISRRNEAARNVKIEHLQRVKNAKAVKWHLLQFTGKIKTPPYELVDLMKIKALIKNLGSHHAKHYAEYLQLAIDKLVGLDELEREIRTKEYAIKLIIGDNTEKLTDYENNSKIQPILTVWCDLILMRAELRDMLDNIDRHKNSDEALASIPVRKFELRSKATRTYNYIWTFLKYDEQIRHTLTEGTHQSVDLGSIEKDLSHYHSRILSDLNDIITTAPDALADFSEIEYFSDSQEDVMTSKTHLDIANDAIKDQISMLKYVVDSRKGFVVLQSEWLRHKFIEEAEKYLHENQRNHFKKKNKNNNGIYRINDTDGITVVNIKVFHNCVVRIERTIELFNQLNEIPIDIKISNYDAIPRISVIASALKIRLNELLTELYVLTESMTALRDCMKNNTFNIFEQDIWAQLNKMLLLTQQCVNFYYRNQPNNEWETLQKSIHTAIEYSKKFMPSNGIKDTRTKSEAIDLKNNVTKYIEIFLERSGQVLPKTENGVAYDVEKLENGSPLQRLADMLNHLKDGSQLQHTWLEEANSTNQQADAVAIINQAIKNAGAITKQVIAARKIKQGMPQDQNIDTYNTLILFLKLFVSEAGAIRQYRDGSYDIDSLTGVSIQKCIAAFLNISVQVEDFMNSTVNMADGHHIIGFIKAMRDLTKIKYQIDQANLTGIFSETLTQLNLDFQVVKIKINELMNEALNYAYPKIIDAVAQARIAEITLGTNENVLLKPLKKALKQFVNLSKSYTGGQFDARLNDLLKNFPYDVKTLEIARSEFTRLKELNRSTVTKHHFLINAIRSLKIYIDQLVKLPVNQAGIEATTKNVPAIMSDKGKEEDIEPVIDIEPPEQLPIFQRGVDINLPVSSILDKKVICLRKACFKYQYHLAEEINRLLEKEKPNRSFVFNFNAAYPEINNTSDILNLTIKKYNVVHNMQQTLLSTEHADVKLATFRQTFTPEYRIILGQRRDTWSITFLKGLATLFSLGIASAFGLWQTRGTHVAKKLDRIALRLES